MTIDTTFFMRCIQTLDKAYSMVNQVEESSIEYDMYRSACVKEFERDNTAHDYGKKFAEYTLRLLPEFIKDATTLEQSVSLHAKRMADD